MQWNIGTIFIPRPKHEGNIDFVLALLLLAVSGVIALLKHLKDK
jgi:hypothetical protein